jgi:benzodiazapine receptor
MLLLGVARISSTAFCCHCVAWISSKTYTTKDDITRKPHYLILPSILILNDFRMRVIHTTILILAAVAPMAQALVLLPKAPFPRVDHALRFQSSRTSTRMTGDPCSMHNTLLSRGGSARGADGDCCRDSDVQLALKAGLSTALETIGLVTVLAGAKQLSSKSMTMVPTFLQKVVGGLPVLQWASLLVVIFGSAELKAVVDGGVSAASRQLLRPGKVPGDGPWYENLKKPWFNPPGWVFPIVWLIVAKPTQMWAASKVLKATAATHFPWSVMPVYCAQLSFGDTWKQVFFGCQRIRLGAGVMCTFWSVLVASAVAFGGVDPTAGLLMLPTVGWVAVASLLNIEYYRLNGEKASK